MDKKGKAATAVTVAASDTTWANPKHSTSNRAKSLIVHVAQWDLIPPATADQLRRIGGLSS